MSASYLLSSSFAIANQSYDLMKIMLDLTKPKEKKSVFPKALYETYVNEIRQSSIDVFKYVSLANKARDVQKRIDYIETVLGLLIELTYLIFYAYEKKWISAKKHDTIQKLITSIYSKSDNWQKRYFDEKQKQ